MFDQEANIGAFDKIVQGAAEKLMEDERLRANLSDDEAKLVFDWAIAWLETRVFRALDEARARQIVQAEVARLRPAMKKISDLLIEGKTPTLSAAARSLGLPGSKTATNPLDRKGLIRALTTLLSDVWRKQ